MKRAVKPIWLLFISLFLLLSVSSALAQSPPNDTTRDLRIEAKNTDGLALRGITFAIYGPYTSEELYGPDGNGLLVTADKLVDLKTTGNDGVVAFTSIQTKYYERGKNYVVVQTAPELETESPLIPTGDDVALPADYPTMTGMGIVTEWNYFVIKQNSSGTSTVTLTTTGTAVPSGVARIAGSVTFENGDPGTTFTFVLVSSGVNADPDFVASYPSGATATNDATGAFAFPDILYDSADIGKSYMYTLMQRDDGLPNVVYDDSTYTHTVKIGEGSNGVLSVVNTITDVSGTPVQNSTYRNVYTGALKITKQTAGNGATADAFSFIIRLTDANDEPITSDVAYQDSDGAAASITPNNNGGFTLTLQNGQSFTLLQLPSGTKCEITEEDRAPSGYTTEIRNAQGTLQNEGSNGRRMVASITGSDTQTFTYTNTRNVGGLRITHAVSGNGADESRAFRYTITLQNANGVDIEGDYECEGVATSISFQKDDAQSTPDTTVATAEISLKHGEQLKVNGIVTGTNYTITQDAQAAEGYTTENASRSGIIGTELLIEAFQASYQSPADPAPPITPTTPPKTKDQVNPWVLMGICGVSAIGVVACVVVRKRRKG